MNFSHDVLSHRKPVTLSRKGVFGVQGMQMIFSICDKFQKGTDTGGSWVADWGQIRSDVEVDRKRKRNNGSMLAIEGGKDVFSLTMYRKAPVKVGKF